VLGIQLSVIPMQRVSYKNYLLTLLMLVLAFNYVDRLALGMILQDIKTDLSLTDTQLGLLTGIAFALFYATMGIPIARWADRGNRVTIISLTTALWSAAVALCGAATGFVQLLLIRIGVAVGEAGCIPPAHSLIADHFSRAERPRAMARYMLGGPLALTVGYFSAGWLNELYGWRATFVMVGLPGLILAALVRFTLKEPRQLQVAFAANPETGAVVDGAGGAHSSNPSYTQVVKTLGANAAFRHLLLCFSVWAFFGYGILQWQPSFFVRSHGLQTGELGVWMAAVYGIGGGLGVYVGGEWAARYAAGNERLQLSVCAIAFALFAVLNMCTYLAADQRLAFASLGLAVFGMNIAQGPILATMQTLIPPRMRATSIALVYLFSNLIGMGLGPLVAGSLSDALQPWLGHESLRYSLVILSPGYFWAAWHLWRASRTVVRDLKAAQLHDPEPATGSIKLAAVAE
jgi:MFS transporter, Spinster family, sphingosine-1-phosphate transporter